MTARPVCAILLADRSLHDWLATRLGGSTQLCHPDQLDSTGYASVTHWLLHSSVCQLAPALQARGAAVADFCVPLASVHAASSGFMLLAGGDNSTLEALTPLLDALAPASGAWLHAGALGSAAFIDALRQRISPEQWQDWLMQCALILQQSGQQSSPLSTRLLGHLQSGMQRQQHVWHDWQQLALHWQAGPARNEARPFVPVHKQTRDFTGQGEELSLASQLAQLIALTLSTTSSPRSEPC